MLNIDFVRQNPDAVREASKKKKIDPKRVDEFLARDEAWRKITKEIDDLRAGQNELSDKISTEKDAAARSRVFFGADLIRKFVLSGAKIVDLLGDLAPSLITGQKLIDSLRVDLFLFGRFANRVRILAHKINVKHNCILAQGLRIKKGPPGLLFALSCNMMLGSCLIRRSCAKYNPHKKER